MGHSTPEPASWLQHSAIILKRASSDDLLWIFRPSNSCDVFCRRKCSSCENNWMLRQTQRAFWERTSGSLLLVSIHSSCLPRVLYLYYEASYLLIAPVIVCMNRLLWTVSSSAEDTPFFVLWSCADLLQSLGNDSELQVCSAGTRALYNSFTVPKESPTRWNKFVHNIFFAAIEKAKTVLFSTFISHNLSFKKHWTVEMWLVRHPHMTTLCLFSNSTFQFFLVVRNSKFFSHSFCLQCYEIVSLTATFPNDY